MRQKTYYILCVQSKVYRFIQKGRRRKDRAILLILLLLFSPQFEKLFL